MTFSHTPGTLCNALLVLVVVLVGVSSAEAKRLRSVPGDTLLPTPTLDVADQRGMPEFSSPGSAPVRVINFWASWCLPCVVELPMLNRLAEVSGLEVVLINEDTSLEAGETFLRRKGLVGVPRRLFDRKGRYFRQFGGGLPLSLVVDRNGRIRYRVAGPLEWFAPEVQQTLESLIREGKNG